MLIPSALRISSTSSARVSESSKRARRSLLGMSMMAFHLGRAYSSMLVSERRMFMSKQRGMTWP